MLVSDILTKAGVIAGLNDFTGASIDQNYTSMALGFLNSTVSDINNDSRLAAKTLRFDMTVDILPQDQAAYDQAVAEWQAGMPEPVPPKPQPLGKSYALPEGTRRVLRAFSNNTDLRKTDISEVIRLQRTSTSTSFFAVNDGKIQLTQMLPVMITYVPEMDFSDLAQKVDVNAEYIPYIIHQTALNLALSFNSTSAETCMRLASQSYDTLMGNLRLEAGTPYVNPYLSLNRFSSGMIG
jgi:hypothetical protein